MTSATLNRPNSIRRITNQIHQINTELADRESSVRYGWSLDTGDFSFFYCEGTLLTTASWREIARNLTVDEAWGFLKELSKQLNINLPN